jgi:hypothetical protein
MEMTMSYRSRVPALAAAVLAGMVASANADTYIYNYYYGDPGAVTRYEVPATTYSYGAPTLVDPPATSYYYYRSTTPYYPPDPPAYYAPAPRYYYYRDPVYAPPFSLEALFSPYSSSSLYNSYRVKPGN